MENFPFSIKPPHSPVEGKPVNEEVPLKKGIFIDWVPARACPREVGGGNEETIEKTINCRLLTVLFCPEKENGKLKRKYRHSCNGYSIQNQLFHA